MAERQSQRHFAAEGPVPYPEDKELMRRVARGDAEAFEPFLRRHADAVFRLSRFMTADAGTARRIAIEAFTEALRAFYPEESAGDGAPAPDPDDFRVWVLRMARRLALAAPPVPQGAIEATGGSADPGSFRKVRELDIDLREAVVLRHLEGLTCGQIGEVCGVSADTAAERLAGARHDLARIVGRGSEQDVPAKPEPAPAGKREGPGRLATGTGIDLFVILSKHIDGEHSPERAKEVERHLKESGGYREEIARLRGADRFAAHAVESVSDLGLIPAAMEALDLRARSVPLGRRRIPRLVLWGLILVTALGAGALVAAGLHALSGGKRTERRILDLRLGEAASSGPRRDRPDRGAAPDGRKPQWRVRKPGKDVAADALAGSHVSTGTELELLAAGGHGTLARPDGLRLYAEAGLRLRIGDDATDEAGFLLERGRVMVVLPEGAARFELAAPGGVRFRFESSPVQALVERLGDPAGGTAASVMSGAVKIVAEGEEIELGAGRRAVAGESPGAAEAAVIDPRVFAVEFVPVSLRPSAWPMKGGPPARSGGSPFPLRGPPVHASTIEGVLGASAVVLGPEGTAYLLAGPQPGRLIGIDVAAGGEPVVSVPFASACTGDPALGPDGKVYARTRDGAVVVFDRALGEGGLETLVPPVPGELTRTGPTVGPDGGVYVAYGSGLAAYSPDGVPRWRRDDISSGSPPSVGPGGIVFVASLKGRLHALDPANGNDTAPKEVSAGEGFLSHVAVGLDGTAYAVSARGKLVWVASAGPHESRSAQAAGEGSFRTVALPESDYALAPAVTLGGEVVVASSRGTVYRLPARPVSAPKTPFFEAGEPIRQGPLVDGEGRVVLITESGVLITIDPTGRSRTSDLDARDASPPAIARDGGLIFLTRDGRVFATRR